MRTKRHNGFSRVAGSTYRCEICGRNTRHTGAQALGSKTCPECWEIAGIENEISDGYRTLTEATTELTALLAAITAKGGNASASFTF